MVTITTTCFTAISSVRSFGFRSQTQRIGGLNGLVLALLTVCLAAAGCNQETVEQADVLDESFFNLNDEQEVASPNAPAAQMVAKTELGVKLQPGDKFPLQKIVEKTLTQTTQQGKINTSERVELMMSVTVEQVEQQRKKFRILYNRVKVDSNINGQTWSYDSQAPRYPLPDPALAYHGMVNNGFSFWVGADNTITELDFSEFLQRCLSHVPAQKADLVAQTIANYSGQEGVANFVDDTIGLLPYNPDSSDGSSVVRIGGSWQKMRQFNDPVPMNLSNTYTLKSVTDDYATVEVTGTIAPAAGVSNPQQGVSLQIRSGEAIGSYTIDRKTGLPLNSVMDHQLTMTVQTDGIQFEQEKRVVTSIRMFAAQDHPAEQPLTAQQASSPAGNAIQPASHSEPQ